MKKFIYFVFLLVSQYTYSGENFKLNFNLATTGIGLNYALNDEKVNGELFVEILTVGIEHKDTNIGAGFGPLKYWYFWHNDEPNAPPVEEERLSFINFNINWDLLNNKNFFLGPFCSINYMFLKNSGMNWAEYVFTGGIRFLWVHNIFKKNTFSSFIGSDIGYRVINGENNFYFNISIDIISWLHFMAYNSYIYGKNN